MGLLVKGRFLVALVENSVSSARYQTDKRGLRMEAYPPPAQGTQVLSAPPVAPAAPLPNPAAFYKKSLRSTIMKTVLAWGLYFVTTTAVQIVIMVAFSVFGTVSAMAQDSQVDFVALTTDLMENMPWGWILLLGALAGTPAFLLLRGKKMFTEDLTAVNERINASSFIALLAITLGCAALLQFGLIALEYLLQLVGLSLPSGGAPPIEDMLSPLVVFHIVLTAPVLEEIVFRGAILRTLRPYGANFAIVISSLIFALTHVYLYQATFAFFIGIVLAYCTLRFSIKWSMLLHILNNGVSMVLTLADPTEGVLTLIVYGAFLVLAIIVGILGFKKFRQQRQDGKPTEMVRVLGIAPSPYATPAPNSVGSADTDSNTSATAALPRTRPFAIAFTSPWLIALIVLTVCASILSLVSSPPLTL
jgi:membrane protease YdiL (CAAX protease family)